MSDDQGLSVKKVLLIVGLLFAVYFPIAMHLKSIYMPIKGPPGSIARMASVTKEAETQYAYYGSVVVNPPRTETLVIFEDDKELGPSNSSLADIRNLGSGRYGLFRAPAFFIFSTSDNSDPKTNGRTYWVVAR